MIQQMRLDILAPLAQRQAQPRVAQALAQSLGFHVAMAGIEVFQGLVPPGRRAGAVEFIGVGVAAIEQFAGELALVAGRVRLNAL
jgi:hypothetical protein